MSYTLFLNILNRPPPKSHWNVCSPSTEAYCMLRVQNGGLKNSPSSLLYLFHGAKKNHMSHKWQLPLGLPKPCKFIVMESPVL